VDAVRLTIQHDPNLKLAEQQTLLARGAFQSETGRFDRLLSGNAFFNQTLTPLATGPEKESEQLTAGVSAAFQVPNREGLTLGGVADASWSKSIFGDLRSEVYTYDVGFTVDAALMRGRGREAVAAQETSARINWEATGLRYKHTASASVLTTILAYWNLVGAQEQLAIAKGSLELANKQVELTNALISGDEIPRAELSRVLASQSSEQASVTLSERFVGEARVALARAMGLSVLDDANAPFAADPFPPVPESSALANVKTQDLIAAAVDRRYDRRAAFLLKESGGVLLAAARTELRPRLDAHGRLTATTVAETVFTHTRGVSFPGIDASLQFE
jgi:outer membrane protein TolC